MSENPENRRVDERRQCNAAFEFALHGECIKTFRPGTSVNVSESGVGIVTDCALEPGQVIIFRSKQEEADIKIAVVQWTMKTGRTNRAGLKFFS